MIAILSHVMKIHVPELSKCNTCLCICHLNCNKGVLLLYLLFFDCCSCIYLSSIFDCCSNRVRITCRIVLGFLMNGHESVPISLIEKRIKKSR
jgi:hypothetical protein